MTGEDRYNIILEALAEAQVVDGSEKPLGVLKELAGGHKEDFIIINLRPGYTFSQATLRKLLGARFEGLDEKDMPQVFIVDMPRVAQVAEAMEQDTNGDRESAMALQAGVAYQLATAATLTDGSLRVFIVK